MSKSSIARRADLESALKRFKKGETIGLEDMARLWGVTKPRFLNVRSDIMDFPDPVGKQANAILYDGQAAIAALLKHEKRNDVVTAARSSKVARILGRGNDEDEAQLPPSELLSLSRAGAEVDKRKREQGQLVRFADVQQVASEVFGEISATLSKLSDLVDPNGKLPGHVRDLVNEGGKDVLLRLYDRLNDMLGNNAVAVAHSTETTRARPNRARRTPVRKKPSRRVRASA